PARAEKSEAIDAARASSLTVVAPAQPASKPAPSEAAATPEAKATTSEAATTVASKSATDEKPEAQAKTEATSVKTPDVGEAATTDASAAKPQPRRKVGVIDEHWLERNGVETLPKVATTELTYDDRAPRLKRIAAAMLDLLVVAFLSAPFAAVIELTIGNWGDPRVWGSMGGIVAVLMFLYLTCSLALASRTLGMKLFALQAVDANTAHAPTTGQCARRALVYMLSLATFGLGILYALFDAEGRTAHDLLSRTVVVKQ
ncbi:MAG TPA: RDD family protein, partial [Pyrinomonadaceae bacterium]|nr:RDD family protein [Pyrinomonadaceae bacterium]